MNNDPKKYFCPRLIDYVIIVGCKDPASPSQLVAKYQQHLNRIHAHNEQSNNLPPTQLPELLRRYPLDDHEDFMLPQDVTYFCQPEGCSNINCSSQTKANSNRETTSFIFSLTEKDSAKVRFGVCINFFRPIEKIIRNSKSNRSKKTEPQVDLVDETDEDDEHFSNDNNSNKSNTSPTNTNAIKKKQKRNKKAKDVKYTHTLTSLCIISHHPFFSIFRECLNILRRIIEACHARSLASKPGTPVSSHSSNSNLINSTTANKLIRDTVWGILTGSSGSISTEQISTLIACEIREIETWILRLLSAPVPVPGKTKLIIDILPNEPPMLFALPDHTRFNLVDFPLHLPLELLDADTCIKVFTLILLENKLIFQSSDYNALTMSIMAFVSLLYPLEYMFPIIPLLPRCMNETEQLLLAPTPFIIGIPASFFQYKSNVELPDDVWLIDLDKNKIFSPRHGEPIPDIPEPEYSILKNHLNQALKSLSSAPQPVKNFESFFSQVQSKEQIIQSFSPVIYGNDVDSVDVATRITMVQFLTSKNILGSFNEHTRILRLYPRPVVAFQYNSFIRSRPIKSNFIIKLGRSQAVEYLAEWSLCPDNVAYLRIQTGIFDPSLIGDKAKWYCRYLTPIQFKTYEEKSTLAAAIQFLKQQENAKTRKDSNEDIPTDESFSEESENEEEIEPVLSVDDGVQQTIETDTEPAKRLYFTPEGKQIGMYPKYQAATMCVDVESVYSPPLPRDRSPSISSSKGDETTSPLTTSISSSSIDSINKNDAEQEEEQLNISGSEDNDDNIFAEKKKENKLTINLKNKNIIIPDSKSQSTNATPVNKNFPRLPFSGNSSVSNSNSYLNNNSTNSSVNSSTTDLISSKQKLRTSSQSSSSTITSMSLKKLKEIKQSINNMSSGTNLSQSYSNTKQSLINQLSEDISSKTKSISGLTTSKHLTNLIGSENPELASSTSISNINKQTDKNNNSIETTSNQESNKKETVRKQNSNGSSNGQYLHHQPAIPESDIMNIPPSVLNQNQEVSELSSENQQFLNEIINSVLEGQGVGYFKNNKIKRLMEDENNRNFVLSRLNTSLDKKLANDEEHIEDVKINRFVFKGMSKLLALIIQGLEHTYANNGLGGMASAFQLLEIAHTHYWLNEDVLINKTSSTSTMNSSIINTNNTNNNNNDGSMSPMSEHSGSPFDSKENLNGIISASSSVYSLASTHKSRQSIPQASEQSFNIQSTSNIVSQLGNLWNSSRLNSFTKSFVSHTSSVPFTSSNGSNQFSKSSVAKTIANNLSSMSNYSLSLSTKSQTATKNDIHINDSISNNNNNNNTNNLNEEIKNSSVELNQTASESTSKGNKPKINHHFIDPSNSVNESEKTTTPQTVTTPSEEKNKKLLSSQESIKLCTKSDSKSILIPKTSLSSGYRFLKGVIHQLQPIGEIINIEKRTYIFEILISANRSPLWDQLQFWEDVFLDAVAQERDIIGLDQGPSEMMERYGQLGNTEKKRLELDEDHLLAVMLYNLIAFMILMKVSKDEIRRKIRRMLGKCHIGLAMSQQVNDLLDCSNILLANDIDLRPAGSRLMQKQSFAVHLGTDNKGDMLFMEVCDDCMILRSVKGEICQRWWFEKLVNMTYCPKTRVLCLWCKQDGETQLNKFYTKKCRELYFSIKEAMEKAVARLNSAIGNNTSPPSSELGGEFQISDLKTNEQGTLEICMEGINLTFNDAKEFIELKRVRKCTTQKDDTFLLEEFDPISKQIVIRRYKSTMASAAIFAFHRICSYQAAVLESKKTAKTKT